MIVTVSELTASQYARELPADVGPVVRQGPKVLTSTLAVSNAASLPRLATITVHGKDYRAVSQTFTGFGRAPVTVTVMSALSARDLARGQPRPGRGPDRCPPRARVRLLAARLACTPGSTQRISGSRTTARKRRLLRTDQGRGERRVRGALGAEFNSMSSQLSRRLDELSASGRDSARRSAAPAARSRQASMGPRCSSSR